MKKFCLAVAVTALLIAASDAEPTEFVRVRAEQPHWEMSQQPQIDRRFALPVYLSWPERAYEVLGYVCVYKDDWRAPEEANLARSAATAAKTRGADAVLIGHVSPDVLELTSGSKKSVLLLGQAIRWSASAR